MEDDIPPVNNEVNLDDDDLGVSEINLDDDDDIFKSARLEPEPAKMMMSEPEPMVRSTGSTEPVLLTNGHHKEQVARAESEEPVETDIPLEVIIALSSLNILGSLPIFGPVCKSVREAEGEGLKAVALTFSCPLAHSYLSACPTLSQNEQLGPNIRRLPRKSIKC